MSVIQISHVPDEVHYSLQRKASACGMTLSDYLLNEIEQIAKQPTLQEMFERLNQQQALHLRDLSAEIVRRHRDA